jgi:hypothetical protein
MLRISIIPNAESNCWGIQSEYITRSRIKSSIFWDMTPCSPLNVNWRSVQTCLLYLPDLRISRTRNQHEEGSKQIRIRDRWTLQTELPSTFNGLHNIISREIEPFITSRPAMMNSSTDGGLRTAEVVLWAAPSIVGPTVRVLRAFENRVPRSGKRLKKTA